MSFYMKNHNVNKIEHLIQTGKLCIDLFILMNTKYKVLNINYNFKIIHNLL